MKNLTNMLEMLQFHKDEKVIEQSIFQMGYPVILQEFAEGINIISEKKGLKKEKIIISAHYDGHGAYDNAGGVVALLGIMHSLKEYKPTNTLQFVFFDKEEQSQKGSKHFLKELTKNERDEIIYNLNIDGCGIGDYLVKANQFKVLGSITDSSVFKQYGVDSDHYFTVSKEDIRRLSRGKLPELYKKLHTPDDNLSIVDEKSLENAIKSVLKIVKEKDHGGLK